MMGKQFSLFLQARIPIGLFEAPLELVIPPERAREVGYINSFYMAVKREIFWIGRKIRDILSHQIPIVSIKKNPDRAVGEVGCSAMDAMDAGILAAVGSAADTLNPSMENYFFCHITRLHRPLQQGPCSTIVHCRRHGSKNFYYKGITGQSKS